jgi:hypothetical protein
MEYHKFLIDNDDVIPHFITVISSDLNDILNMCKKNIVFALRFST